MNNANTPKLQEPYSKNHTSDSEVLESNMQCLMQPTRLVPKRWPTRTSAKPPSRPQCLVPQSTGPTLPLAPVRAAWPTPPVRVANRRRPLQRGGRCSRPVDQWVVQDIQRTGRLGWDGESGVFQ